MSLARITGSTKIINNTNNCGGNKKAGLPSLIGHQAPYRRWIKTNCYPDPTDPFVISSVNQLGGVGRVQSMMKQPADGVNRNKLRSMQSKCKVHGKNAVLRPMW